MSKKSLTLGIDSLEDRQMMAADLGVAEILPSPLMAEQAEVSTPMYGQRSGDPTMGRSSNDNGFQITPNWRIDRLNLIIAGTEYNDEITITQLDNGYIRVSATTTNDAGTQLGSTFQDYHPNAFVHIFAVMDNGNDALINRVSSKTALVYGGEGDDYLNSAGRASLFGQGGDDVLWGSSQGDYISGGRGEDFIYGRAGNDTLDGGSFDDLIYGGSGDDLIDGGSGWDRLFGHAGDDVMRGGVGEDFMDGGWDNDILFGGDHDDTMEGGSGNDILRGQKGDDRLEGESGHDKLDGGSGDDLLLGNSGNDELIGRSGFDRLFGGGNDDLMDGGDDGIADIIHGGSGNDTFVRHKHFFTLDDPDQFLDYKADAGDERFNDYGWADYGNGYPDEDDYFN